MNELENLDFAWCAMPIAPVKKNPEHRSELVTQLLFGDVVQVLEKNNIWSKIKILHDEYEGYVLTMQLTKISPSQAQHYEKHYALINVLTTSTAQDQIPLTMGCRVPTALIQDIGQNIEVKLPYPKKLLLSKTEVIFDNYSTQKVVDLAKRFLYVPYLWGGKSAFGLDCSGFTQLVFRMIGIFIYRDAHQQATQGIPVSSLSQAKPGDLIFFRKPDAAKISHVGIYAGNYEVIHSAGYVHIAKVDDVGLHSIYQEGYSHKLVSIRRYW
ncbi:MAG: C40 family peptidase [Bacteroidia bacterium]|nr:C40 family peptidase [Bacteroidia bacterium]MDW8301878.1 C40 family peptidase [Bacteroidia bacterium]